MTLSRFQDRTEAGERLAARVSELGLADPVVYALPRGGVPVAGPVAMALGAPLDLIMVRKLGVPGHEELAAGAVVDGAAHDVVFNENVLCWSNVTSVTFNGKNSLFRILPNSTFQKLTILIIIACYDVPCRDEMQFCSKHGQYWLLH